MRHAGAPGRSHPRIVVFPADDIAAQVERAVNDGGVIDNVPVCALDEAPGATLVMLTRRYPALPNIPGRTYVQPSTKIPVDAWDYTSPEGIQSVYDLGRRDGEEFLKARRR